MNKTQLREKADSLGVEYAEDDTNKELEDKIAKAESAKIDEKSLDEKVQESAVVTSGQTAASDSDTVEVEDDDVEDVEEDDEPATTESESTEDTVVLKYVGESGTYQVGPYTFSKADPFHVVDAAFADRVLEGSVDLEESSKSEAEDFYK